MMAKYDDEDENDEDDGLDLLSLADFDGERGGGGELGCQGAGHQGGEEESKTEHSEQFQLFYSTMFRQWRTERSYQNTSRQYLLFDWEKLITPKQWLRLTKNKNYALRINTPNAACNSIRN